MSEQPKSGLDHPTTRAGDIGAPDKWQPIETAPDETPVWLADASGNVWIGERAYDSDGWLWGNTYMAVHQRTDGTWASTSNEWDDDYQPVMWMPLPPAPVRRANVIGATKQDHPKPDSSVLAPQVAPPAQPEPEQLLRQAETAMARLLDASFEDHEEMHRFAEDVLPAYAVEGLQTSIDAIRSYLSRAITVRIPADKGEGDKSGDVHLTPDAPITSDAPDTASLLRQALQALEGSRPLKADYLSLEAWAMAKRRHETTVEALRLAGSPDRGLA